jgi:hypothetical protein
VAEFLSKEALLARRFGVHDLEVEGVGVVQVRPLSRAEALEVQGVEMPVAVMEQKLISKAMVSPKLTEDDVRVWQENSPAGELEPVGDKIMILSGMKKESAKEAVKTFRDES